MGREGLMNVKASSLDFVVFPLNNLILCIKVICIN